jgi:hypothetical protein
MRTGLFHTPSGEHFTSLPHTLTTATTTIIVFCISLHVTEMMPVYSLGKWV